MKLQWLRGQWLREQRPALIAVASALLLLLALILLSSLSFNRQRPERTLTVLNDVRLLVPPAPPPTPPSSSRSRDAAGSAPVVVNLTPRPGALDLMPLDTRIQGQQSISLGSGLGGSGLGLSGMGAGGGLEGLAMRLDQLDAMPIVLSAPVLPYPQSLIQKGILRFQAVFHILVDETGHTRVLRVLESPDASLNPELVEFASHVVFSPPTSKGKAVAAQYSWPVMFEYKGGAKRR